MALGWKETDAYIAIGQLKPVLSDDYNKTQRNTCFASEYFHNKDPRHWLKQRGTILCSQNGFQKVLFAKFYPCVFLFSCLDS